METRQEYHNTPMIDWEIVERAVGEQHEPSVVLKGTREGESRSLGNGSWLGIQNTGWKGRSSFINFIGRVFWCVKYKSSKCAPLAEMP